MDNVKKFPESYRLFLQTAKKMTGWDTLRIRDELKAKFDKFEPAKTSTYYDYLSRLVDNEWNLEAELAKRKSPKYCQICGAKTYGVSIYGIPQGLLWACVVGGTEHCYEARVNNLRRSLGKPLIFKEVEHESDGDDTPGDTESGCSGLPSDTGEGTVLGHNQHEAEEEVQACTPARL